MKTNSKATALSLWLLFYTLRKRKRTGESEMERYWGAWLAQPEEHETFFFFFDLRVVGFNYTLSVEIT